MLAATADRLESLAWRVALAAGGYDGHRGHEPGQFLAALRAQLVALDALLRTRALILSGFTRIAFDRSPCRPQT